MLIQIDMPMPEACDVCPFNYDFCWCKAFGNHDEWEKYSEDWNDHVCDRETRPEYCPLKEIVRCKDCKYWSAERINDFNKCRRWINVGVKNFATMGDWFCADGERK